MQTLLVSYLLEDVYDVDSDKVAGVAGNLGMVSEIGGLGAEVLLGFLQDLLGRKVLTVAGMMIASTSVICKPLPNNIAGLYCLRFCTNMGLIPIMYTPFTIDYIHKDSLSVTAGFMSIVGVSASLSATSGVI